MINGIEESKTVESFLSFLRECNTRYFVEIQNQAEADNETQDILHAIEFGEYAPRRTAKLTQKLQTTRRKRRLAKDAVEELSLIQQWAENNKPVIKSLERLLGELRRVEKKNSNRNYIPRTDIMAELSSGSEEQTGDVN